jgi:hypothetical protein
MEGKDLNNMRALFMKVDMNTSKNTDGEEESKGITKFNYHKRHNSHLIAKLKTKKQMDFSLVQTG